MKKRSVFIFSLLASAVIALLAYGAGSQSDWLSGSQINFTDKLSTNHGNLLKATVRDALMNGLTTRATNHEKRLQAFAQTSGYPNLTSEQITFTDLLSTKNNNQLTSGMWNGLITRLTTAVTNHEMRLRELEKPVVPSQKVDGKCGNAIATCLAGDVKWDNGKTSCGTTRFWSCEGNNGWSTAYCSFQNEECVTYSCVGDYTITYRKSKANTNVFCFCKEGEGWRRTSSDENCTTSKEIVDPFPEKDYDFSTYKNREFPNWRNEKICIWGAYDGTTATSPAITFMCSAIAEIGEKPTECMYACAKNQDERFCEKEYRKISCSGLGELACRAKIGCRWGK